MTDAQFTLATTRMKQITKIALLAAAHFGTTKLHAQSDIPIRQPGKAEAISRDVMGSLNGLRELSTGELLVNDAGNRRILILDKTLATVRVAADSSSATHNLYGKRATGIIPYSGDTTLLIDIGARAFLVMTPTGAVTRVMSPPRANDVGFMGSSSTGVPGFDSRGRLVYRGTMMPAFTAPVAGKTYEAPNMPDSAPILLGDFNKRAADTLAWVRIPKMRITVATLPGGGVTMSPMLNPLANIDDWTLLPDGSVAVLRGQDYHIDWFNADGTRVSSPKMPFDWKRISQEEKVAIVDSVKKAMENMPAGMIANAGNAHGAPVGGGHGMTIMPITSGDGGPPPQSTVGANASIPVIPQVAPPGDLPDYYPPVLRSGLMKADADGNVWILPSTSAQSAGGLLYDVVNRKGQVFQHVRFPEGRALEGFGAGGAIYLSSHDATGSRLERVRLQHLK